MDDEKKIQRYFGYETLVKLGGFIGAKAQSLLYDLYPDEVCEVIENTGGIDENFWTLAYELRFVLDGYNTPEIYKENDDGTEEAVWADRGEGSFFMFHMVATAVCIRNKKYHKKQLYGSFKVSKKLKNLLLSLAPLESTILWEYLGLGVSEAGPLRTSAGRWISAPPRHLSGRYCIVSKVFLTDTQRNGKSLQNTFRICGKEKVNEGFDMFCRRARCRGRREQKLKPERDRCGHHGRWKIGKYHLSEVAAHIPCVGDCPTFQARCHEPLFGTDEAARL
jgi:hypothetical protein